MKNCNTKRSLLLITGTVLIVALAAYAFIPGVEERVNLLNVWVRGSLFPVGDLPTAAQASPLTVEESLDILQIASTEPITQERQSQPVTTQSALPVSQRLEPPAFDPTKDYQDWNNCGPATLALGLRFWGWQGDQHTIQAVIKPSREDKNVNADELAAYVLQQVPGLQAEVRVGGDLNTLKRFLAAGYPVIVEESFKLDKAAWPGDDLWAAHYLLLTGYDDSKSLFVVQDSYHGPDRLVSYDDLAYAWQSFNHLYLVLFPSDRVELVKNLFGVDWPEVENLRRTTLVLQQQLKIEPGNAYLWFNLGSSLVASQDYQTAVAAFKSARQIGLPQRMLRYQFGPLVAAYQTGDLEDLNQMLDFSLKITPDSEEALYWKGMLSLKSGDPQGAMRFFNLGLRSNQNNLAIREKIKEITS